MKRFIYLSPKDPNKHLSSTDHTYKLLQAEKACCELTLPAQCCGLALPAHMTHGDIAPAHRKIFWRDTCSCAIAPATASIARRPLEISLFCNSNNSLSFLGFIPSGSKPRSPGIILASPFIIPCSLAADFNSANPMSARTTEE